MDHKTARDRDEHKKYVSCHRPANFQVYSLFFGEVSWSRNKTQSDDQGNHSHVQLQCLRFVDFVLCFVFFFGGGGVFSKKKNAALTQKETCNNVRG